MHYQFKVEAIEKVQDKSKASNSYKLYNPAKYANNKSLGQNNFFI